MNLALELHRMTGRIGKARRRGRRYTLRGVVLWFSVSASWLLCALTEPAPWSSVFPALGTAFLVLAHWMDRKAAVYQRVVDRCHGAMLTIFAVQRWQMDEDYARRRGSVAGTDKRRWS